MSFVLAVSIAVVAGSCRWLDHVNREQCRRDKQLLTAWHTGRWRPRCQITEPSDSKRAKRTANSEEATIDSDAADNPV
jgi:hypothetical protein